MKLIKNIESVASSEPRIRISDNEEETMTHYRVNTRKSAIAHWGLVAALALTLAGSLPLGAVHVNASAGMTLAGAPLAIHGYDAVAYFDNGRPVSARPFIRQPTATLRTVLSAKPTRRSLKATRAVCPPVWRVLRVWRLGWREVRWRPNAVPHRRRQAVLQLESRHPGHLEERHPRQHRQGRSELDRDSREGA